MAVIICFLVCWTPYHVQRIMFVFVTKTESWTPKLFETAEILHLISGKYFYQSTGQKKKFRNVLFLSYIQISTHNEIRTMSSFLGCCYFLSSTINPFLYSLLSKRFRRGFHDLKHKLKGYVNRIPFRNTLTNTSSRIKNGQIPMTALNNNRSLKSHTKKVQSRNTIKRHFGQQASWAAKYANEEGKERVHEMPRLLSDNIDYCNLTTFHPTFDTPKVEFVRIDNESLFQRNGSESAELKIQKSKRNCKYKVSFKSHTNTRTTLMANSNPKKLNNTTKKMQRCRPMYDLTNIGESSTVLCLKTKRFNQSFKVNCNTLADDEVFGKRRHFLSNSHSFRT